MWELDCEETWVPKNWCFWTVVLEKTLESPLDCKEIQPVHPKEDQPWVFIGRTDAEAETPVLWPPDVKIDSLEKTLMLGGIGAGEEEDGRGWVGCMASLTQWTWVWVNFGSWWWTGRPGVLRFMGCQGAGHDWATELNWMELREPTCQVERRSRASVTVECLSSTIWHAGWHKLQPRVSGLAPRTHWQVHYRMLFYGDLASWASADSAVPAAFCKNQLFYLLVKHTVILIGTGSD